MKQFYGGNDRVIKLKEVRHSSSSSSALTFYHRRKPRNVIVIAADFFDFVHKTWNTMHFNNVPDWWTC